MFFNKHLFGAVALLLFSYFLNAESLVQVIHNSADPATRTVDIYVNGNKPVELDDFEFRSATQYLPLPSGIDITITVALPTSSDVTDGVVGTFELGQLTDGESYAIVANGIAIDPENYMNPDEQRSIEFDLEVLSGGIEAEMMGTVDVNVFHGVTDAPAVDVYLRNFDNGDDFPETPQIPNLDYKDFSGYVALNPANWMIRVTAAGNPDIVVGEYFAILSTAVGTKVNVLASGFLTTDDETDDVTDSYGFTLNAVTPAGNAFALSQWEYADVQLIHNAADPAANVVDIYVNGTKPEQLEDFTFRTATEYLELEPGISTTISVNLPNSMDVNDGVVSTFELPVLEANREYVVVANGVLGDNFNTPDDMRSIAFDLYPVEGKSVSGNDMEVAINAWHGSTDAPAVDIYADITGEPLVPNLDYANASGWVNVPNNDITLTLTVAGNKDAVAGEFAAPLSAFGGQSLFVFASGFHSADDEPIDPITNEFGLFVATSEGAVVELSPTASVYFNNTNVEIFPNPSNGIVNINTSENYNSIKVFDAAGNLVLEQINSAETIDFNNLNSGQYFIALENNNEMISLESVVITK